MKPALLTVALCGDHLELRFNCRIMEEMRECVSVCVCACIHACMGPGCISGVYSISRFHKFTEASTVNGGKDAVLSQAVSHELVTSVTLIMRNVLVKYNTICVLTFTGFIFHRFSITWI